tara:strand:- start:1983 stop:2738 length:756 start_codon:yes stop_codon:yes gene_type:complete
MSELLEKLQKLSKMMKEEKHHQRDEIRIVESAGVVNDTRDFVFTDGSMVAKGTPYHIHINDNNKGEIYMTGEKHTNKSKIIYRNIGNTTLGEYTRISKRAKRQEYLKPFVFEITNKDIKRGFAKRSFVKEKFGGRDMYEISESDSQKKAPMYEIYTMKWFVGTDKSIIEPFNINSMELAKKNGFNLDDVLSPLSGFVDTESLAEERAKGMIQTSVRTLRQKSDRVREETTTQVTQTSSPSPSSGGGGGSAY